MTSTRHGVNSVPELELMVNLGIGIDYLKKNWNWENWNWSFLQKKEIHKLIYHIYNVNTYMWCYQYTGTITNLRLLYILPQNTGIPVSSLKH